MKTLLTITLLFCLYNLQAQDTMINSDLFGLGKKGYMLGNEPIFTPIDTSKIGIYEIWLLPDSTTGDFYGVVFNEKTETMKILGIYEGKHFFFEVSKKGEILQQENIK